MQHIHFYIGRMTIERAAGPSLADEIITEFETLALMLTLHILRVNFHFGRKYSFLIKYVCWILLARIYAFLNRDQG